jgi:electron transport complex protein RnfG
MAKILKLGAVLFVITAVTGLVLGGVYTMTLEPINIAKEKEKAEALAQTLPEASEFEGIEIQQGQGVIKEVNRGLANGETVGYNITVTPKGYSGLIEMVVGISKEGKLANIKILSHTETPGLGAKAAEPAFSGQFRNKKTDELTVTKTSPGKDSEIQAISGATITSRAVTSGVNTALKYWKANYKDGGAAAQTDPATAEPEAVSSASKKTTGGGN